jgi:hypothetical protein
VYVPILKAMHTLSSKACIQCLLSWFMTSTKSAVLTEVENDGNTRDMRVLDRFVHS